MEVGSILFVDFYTSCDIYYVCFVSDTAIFPGSTPRSWCGPGVARVRVHYVCTVTGRAVTNNRYDTVTYIYQSGDREIGHNGRV
jgi:hypothetical protein